MMVSSTARRGAAASPAATGCPYRLKRIGRKFLAKRLTSARSASGKRTQVCIEGAELIVTQWSHSFRGPVAGLKSHKNGPFCQQRLRLGHREQEGSRFNTDCTIHSSPFSERGEARMNVSLLEPSSSSNNSSNADGCLTWPQQASTQVIFSVAPTFTCFTALSDEGTQGLAHSDPQVCTFIDSCAQSPCQAFEGGSHICGPCAEPRQEGPDLGGRNLEIKM